MPNLISTTKGFILRQAKGKLGLIRRRFIESNVAFKYYASRIPGTKRYGSPQGHLHADEVRQNLHDIAIETIPYKVNVDEYKNYLCDADYSQFQTTRGDGRIYGIYFYEKTLEHYLSVALMNFEKEDIYIDVASGGSPMPDIIRRLYSCKTYRQDLAYPPGIHGDTIGSDAGDMPVEDGFASKMTLHCSFEHFEGDADIRFVKEAARVLRKGGKVFIAPLYLHKEYAIATDPVVSRRMI